MKHQIAETCLYLIKHHSINMYGGSGGISPRIEVGTRWRWVVSFTLRPVYLWGIKCPIGYEAGWALESVWTLWQRKRVCFLAGFEPGRPVTTDTGLVEPLYCFYPLSEWPSVLQAAALRVVECVQAALRVSWILRGRSNPLSQEIFATHRRH